MRLDLSPLEKSLARLKTSIAYLRSDAAQADEDLRIQFQQSVIKAFEFTYAVTIAIIDRVLREAAGQTETVKEMDFPDRMREAADCGLIRDPRNFFKYRTKRNTTAYAYNQATAENILSVVDNFVADAEFLLERLRARNK